MTCRGAVASLRFSQVLKPRLTYGICSLHRVPTPTAGNCFCGPTKQSRGVEALGRLLSLVIGRSGVGIVLVVWPLLVVGVGGLTRLGSLGYACVCAAFVGEDGFGR